ncbi:MAG: NUDIX hydrolase [Anaerolineae bacterium]|jgi:8-oxo-dGTP pyrophosphatase MutT (NUDIX family)
MMPTISDFFPEGAEAGVGLALQDNVGRYLFFIAGKRRHCQPGERFYAGIGGHREDGEDWLACAHREALEEVGTDVELLASPVTWYLPHDGSARQVEVTDRPRPLALYEMIHPPGTPHAGALYRIVVYQAQLQSLPRRLAEDEVQAVIALTREQVICGPERRPTLADLLDGGARIVAQAEPVDRGIRLYPLGTACALAHILRHAQGQPPPFGPLR